MSCVLPENPSEKTYPMAAETAAGLAQGLHAMAQPLTILRGAAGALQLSPSVSVSDRRYVEMCAVQAERLCEMIVGLRDRLDAAQSEAAALREKIDAKITSECLDAAV
jgi:nitrogen-specific signal transduction histidine kinase